MVAEPVVDPAFGELPAPVRQRLVSWVAAGLPEVAVLPPALRRIRDFAPARRARAGGTAIALALEDPEFRERAALVVPAGSDDADPATSTAHAWLARGEGWEETYAAGLAALAERARDDEEDDRRLARTSERLEQAESALREARSRHRAELEELKAENARLRRTLGDERRAGRESRDAVQASLAAGEAARSAAETLAAAREREVRQLQARVQRLEADAGTDRRTARSEREEATVRARLLLDTVVDAAAGLQRELGLPASAGTPGERLERTFAGADGDAVEPAVPDSPARLDHYLAMPRARLLVDGYNVTKSVWDSVPLESQRIRLLRALGPLVARTGAETTVVFDAHQAGSRPVVGAPRGVRVVFSPEGVIADDVIRDLVAAEPSGRIVVVVTGDAELAGDVRRAGARVCAARSLLALIGS